MPVKDVHGQFFAAAIESLLLQTEPAWRLLVIAETSDRGDVDRGVAPHAADRRIAVVENEGRKLAGALNTGMRRAGTEFVAILLGDDLWAPDAVAVLAASMDAHPEADFFHSARKIVDDDGHAISSVYPAQEQVSLEDFHTHAPVKHLLCWRRPLALSIGGMDETLNSVGPDDFDFPWSMAEHGARFRAIPEALYLYRDHRAAHRLTTHLPRSVHVREIRRILRKHGLGRADQRSRIAQAKRTYLRQCLYRSSLDRWWKTRTRHEPASGWRDQYH